MSGTRRATMAMRALTNRRSPASYPQAHRRSRCPPTHSPSCAEPDHNSRPYLFRFEVAEKNSPTISDGWLSAGIYRTALAEANTTRLASLTVAPMAGSVVPSGGDMGFARRLRQRALGNLPLSRLQERGGMQHEENGHKVGRNQ